MYDGRRSYQLIQHDVRTPWRRKNEILDNNCIFFHLNNLHCVFIPSEYRQ